MMLSHLKPEVKPVISWLEESYTPFTMLLFEHVYEEGR